MGGVFNLVNMQMYHYAGNNPLKYTDPDGNITHDQHFNRNQYQNGYAPLNRGRMDIMVKLGLFTNQKNTGTHNLTVAQDTPEGRAAVGARKFGTNTDFRGKIGTIFEGMQFIYDKEGELVLDATNKGTFDYNSPFSGIPYFSHKGTDIDPWIDVGNGTADNKADVVMDEKIWDQIQSVFNSFEKGDIKKKDAQKQIQVLFPKPNPRPEVTPGWED
jgi:hypothetical protein